MFTERECDAMDRAHEQDRDREDRCRLNVRAPSGVLIGCARDKGHGGVCMTRGGIAEVSDDGDDDYAWERAEAGLEARFDLIDANETPEGW